MSLYCIRLRTPSLWWAAGLSVLLAACGDGQNKPAAGEQTSVMATVQCQAKVQQTLAAPSEARFPNLSQPPFRDVQSDESVRIHGIVDAQNRWGATRRLGYKCHLRYDKGDPAAVSSWQFFSVKVDPIE